MPGQRAPGQKPVLVVFDKDFLREVDRAFKKAGYSERSKFIRDAIFEKLKRMGIRCDYAMAMAPVRIKNGNNRIQHFEQNVHLNEEPSGYGSDKKKRKKT